MHIESVDAARQEFGVNLVLEGSLHTSGKQIRVNFILVDTRTRRQLRASSLTFPDEDGFRAEDAVVNAAFEMLGMDSRLNERPTREGHGTQVAGVPDRAVRWTRNTWIGSVSVSLTSLRIA